MRNPQASIVHSPHLHEGTLKHEDLFESLTVYVSVCTILCAGVNRGPVGIALTKYIIKIVMAKQIVFQNLDNQSD